MMVDFTEAEYREFVATVEGCESLHNLTRIKARLDQKALIEKLGKEKCDAMFAKLTGDTK